MLTGGFLPGTRDQCTLIILKAAMEKNRSKQRKRRTEDRHQNMVAAYRQMWRA
jgi:hypothetical protein